MSGEFSIANDVLHIHGDTYGWNINTCHFVKKKMSHALLTVPTYRQHSRMAPNYRHIIALSWRTVHIPILLLDTVVSYNETPFNQQLPLQDQLTAVQVQLEALSIGPAQEQDAKEDHAVETDVEHDNAVETDVEHNYAVETDVERDNAVEDQDMLVDRVNGDYEFEEEET